MIAQIALGFVTVFAMLVIGMQIFGLGRINPDEILPWAYIALVSWIGFMICLFIRLGIRFRHLEKKMEELEK